MNYFLSYFLIFYHYHYFCHYSRKKKSKWFFSFFSICFSFAFHFAFHSRFAFHLFFILDLLFFSKHFEGDQTTEAGSIFFCSFSMLTKLVTTDTEIFSAASKETYELMKSDPFERFCRSDLFTRLQVLHALFPPLCYLLVISLDTSFET